jgi:hypothetical protein
MKREISIALMLIVLASTCTSIFALAANLYFTTTQSSGQGQDLLPEATPTPTPTPTATPTPTPSPSPTPGATGTATTFYLPPATVGVASESYVDATVLTAPMNSPPADPILTITTTGTTPMYLHISCTNKEALTAYYSDLQLLLMPHGDSGTVYTTLNILDTNTLSYQLPAEGVYNFDYIFHYTATTTGTAPAITLSVTVSDQE